MKYKVLIPQEVSSKAIAYLEENDCECICLEDCSVETMCKYVGAVSYTHLDVYKRQSVQMAEVLKLWNTMQ